MYETIIIKNNNGTYELDIFPESYEDRPSKKEKITYTFKDNTFTGFTYWPMKWEFIIIVYPDKNELLFTYPDDNSPKWHKYKYHKLNTQP